MSRAADSRFDEVPEPRGRPLECTLCGSGAHNRGMCPWGAENYRMPGPDQSPARPFLEELSVHLDGQEVPKPHPPVSPAPSSLRQEERLALAQAINNVTDSKDHLPPVTGWRRFLSALRQAIGFGSALAIAATCGTLLPSCPVYAQDSWAGKDKPKHAAVSFALGSAASQAVKDPWQAFGLAMLPGLLKEVHDSRKGGSGFSVKDLTANAVGASLGAYAGHCWAGASQVQCRWEFQF